MVQQLIPGTLSNYQLWINSIQILNPENRLKYFKRVKNLFYEYFMTVFLYCFIIYLFCKHRVKNIANTGLLISLINPIEKKIMKFINYLFIDMNS